MSALCEDDIVTGVRPRKCERPAKVRVLDRLGRPGKALCGTHRRSYLAWIPDSRFVGIASDDARDQT